MEPIIQSSLKDIKVASFPQNEIFFEYISPREEIEDPDKYVSLYGK